MTRTRLASLSFLLTLAVAPSAFAVRSAELYTSASYGYGRMEARIRFAGGDGIVSSFFAWKEGSEVAGTFWNELDFEKIGGNCQLATNPLYGNPAKNNSVKHNIAADFCGEYHVYAYEWTPDAIAWFVDGVEIRRETGEVAQAFAQNAPNGMQVHFNVWPGDQSFGGNFDPAILPVHQYIDWVQFYSYNNGSFTLAWREDFDSNTVPAGWLTGTWESPKNRSTHDPANVNFINGYAVLSVTADNATGPAGAMPEAPDGDIGGGGGNPGAGGAPGTPGGGDPGTGGSAPGTPGGGTPGGGGSDGTGQPGDGAGPGAGGSGTGPGTPGGTPGTPGTPDPTNGAGGGGVTDGAGGSSTAAPASSTTSSGCSVSTPSESRNQAWLAGLFGLVASVFLRRTSRRSA